MNLIKNRYKFMNNKSILDQIITNHKAEEVARLDAVEIINSLFNDFSERECDILTRRFGLHGQSKETLDKIGKIHSLTRERIRQIEVSSIKKLKQLKNLEDHIGGLKKVINQSLEEHGGLMEREYLLDNLVNFSVDSIKAKLEDKAIHKSYLDFLITKLLDGEFEEVSQSKNFKNSIKLKYQTIDHLEMLAGELLEKIRHTKEILLTEEIINLAKRLNSYHENKENFNTPSSFDISNVLGSNFFEENAGLIHDNKVLYSILRSAHKIEQNKFGYWGKYNWRNINPKTINDKICLVLKNYNKPMHFVEIADRINKVNFDRKKANAATVHNELILDDKYVLVGRGLYGLKDWGYQKGTVADVVEGILTKADKTLSREEIIEKVLEKRLVKKATIILALMNKERFEKVGGKYKIREKTNNQEVE